MRKGLSMSGDSDTLGSMIRLRRTTLDEAERYFEDVSSTLHDGEALDAILAFIGVSGEEITDADVLERIAEVIDLWRVRQN